MWKEKGGTHVCICIFLVSLPLLTKPPGFSSEVSTLMILYKPNHSPKPPLLKSLSAKVSISILQIGAEISVHEVLENEGCSYHQEISRDLEAPY
jgi:hypothetical protein